MLRCMQSQNMMINENPILFRENLNWAVKMDTCFDDQNLAGFSIYGGADTNCSSLITTTSSSSSLAATKMVENQSSAIVSARKRKADFEVEEECIEKKRIEGQARETESEITVKCERESSKDNSKGDYIHVRARRGQATDSHSLAERARREKIGKKMRHLQDLVPGCNKVTGKAGMLDEIINYVQSLQKQVEFLSMKLGAFNPRQDFNLNNLFAKEFPAYMASFPSATATIDMANSNCFHGATNSGVDIVTHGDGGTQMMPQRSDTSSISTPEMFLDSSLEATVTLQQLQQLQNWPTDLQNIYNFNFH